MRALEEQYRNGDVPLPPYWGGFRVVPDSIEFWQGRPDRLHDRLRYTSTDDGGWTIERLSP
jgi:pyridoxamine 5'-phosphate oxidase